MFGRIYKITNNVNDIVYIGQTIEDLNIRLSKHKYEIKREKSYFYKEMTKIGTKNFQIEEIEKIYGIDKIDLNLKLRENETKYIRFFRNNNIKLYNILNNN